MSNEISFNQNVSLRIPGIVNPVQWSVNRNFDQATPLAQTEILTISTADTVLSLATVTTPAWLIIQNLDTTNYLDIGPTSAGAIVPMIRLAPGATGIPGAGVAIPLTPGVTLRTQAHTASVQVSVQVWNA